MIVFYGVDFFCIGLFVFSAVFMYSGFRSALSDVSVFSVSYYGWWGCGSFGDVVA